MSESMLVALGIVIGGVPALVLAVRDFFRGRHQNRQEARASEVHERDTTIGHLENQIERLEKQIERLESQITRHEAQAEAQQAVINRIDRKLSACRGDQIRNRIYTAAVVEYSKRLAQQLQAAGIPFEPLPPLPPPPEAETEIEEIEFEARTRETTMNINAGVDEQLRKAHPTRPETDT